MSRFKEDFPESINFQRSAVELCLEFFKGNERIMASTLYTIGCSYQQISNNAEAAKAFAESLKVLREYLITVLAENQQAVPADITDEKLLQPSIFDSERVKDLKGILSDVMLKLQETLEQDKINVELAEIKRAEGEEVQVDANFGKAMANADQFKDMTCTIKIGKKRTTPDVATNGVDSKRAADEPDSGKRLKVDKPTAPATEETSPKPLN